MEKKKYRKLITNAELRRKTIINLIIFIICAIGFGYAVINLNINLQGEVSVAKLKVTCNAGTYLPHASKSCSDCPAGSFCSGNTFSYHPLENQGILACPIGSISTSNQSSCSVCPNGKTTADVGSTSCGVDCSNSIGVFSWETPTINREVITNLCTIQTCREGYTKNENSCVANTYQVGLNSGDGVTSTGSVSVLVTYEANVPVITPPTKKGYTFLGYYTGENGEGTQYIKADGTSNHVWDLTTGTTLYAKWLVITVTCGEGEYLPADATSCTTCPPGSSCSGGDYNYNEITPQGNTLCPTGTYSTGGAKTCSSCSGGTNSLVGATTCGETCPNADHVSTWSTACNISTCDNGYEISNNVCVRRQFNVTLNNQGATIPGSSSVVVTYNQPVPSITIPEKYGYTFMGYYTKEDGEGTQYIKGDGTSAKDWDKTADTTLYANWLIVTKN
ncbi:MAG: InlB B-repeat-containing protein, partial [Bacilli bacterium]|nr:InlB B-repeat-containing protein [Bacilli bacterium]